MEDFYELIIKICLRLIEKEDKQKDELKEGISKD